MKQVLVLFDIDGTLLLSGGAGRRAILAALADLTGSEATDPAFERVRFDGKTDPEIAAELFTAAGVPELTAGEGIPRLLERYVTHLERDLLGNGHRAHVMPGIRDLLDLLEREDRVLLGLLTGNISRGAELKLRAVDLAPERFRVGAYGSDHAVRASLPPIAVARATPWFGRPPHGREVVIIGDTPADVTCGHCVGARAIGVATGSYSTDALAAAGADAVFESFGDVAAACRVILDAR